MSRRLTLPALLALTAILLAAPATASASLLPWCGGGTTTDCIVSADHAGTPIASGDPTYDVQFSLAGSSPTRLYNIQVTQVGMGFTLPIADQFTVTVNTGAHGMYEAFNRGQFASVTFGGSAASHTTTVAMRPVRQAYMDSGCGGTGMCPSVADHLGTGYWEAWLDDAGFADTAEYRNSLRGFVFSTNADWASSPPQLDFDTNTIQIDIANAHFEPDGTTVVHGRAEFWMPNAMLTGLYNVDAPATLTAGSFAVTTGGGGSTTVTPDADGVAIVIDGLTFSKHKLHVIGHTNPTRPKSATAKRTSPTTALIRLRAAKARGSRIRGYMATCRSGSSRVKGTTKDHSGPAKIRIRGLIPGMRYRCNVQARSHAGPSAARHVKIPFM